MKDGEIFSVMNSDQIIKGVTVFLKTQPGRLGVLTGNQSPMGPLVMAEVDWGDRLEKHDIRILVERDVNNQQGMRSVVQRGEYGTIDDLRRRITYEKLQGTLTDVFYSMSAAEIDFYPHQFKPVLRFIDSPTNRILIADEVGLGKTIEAGLIWTECQARFQARRLLVICPPMLCSKWVKELRERFQLNDIREIKVDGLTDLMKEFERLGNQLSYHVVCSYRSLLPNKSDKQLLRPLALNYSSAPVIDESLLSPRGQLLKKFTERDGEHPFADLVIFDEAHVMKNTDTATHMVGRIVSAESDAVVSLSATPIHNKSRDLYALMQMVDPDFFRDENAYNRVCEQNHPLVALLNILSRPNPTKEKVLTQIHLLEGNQRIKESGVFQTVKRMAEQFVPTPEHIVNMFNKLDMLNLFSGYINRTRKSQIDDKGRVQRSPVKLIVNLNDEELTLYKAVLSYIRNRVMFQGKRASIFHIMGPALRMASCLPVMANLLRNGRWGDIDEILEVEETYGEVTIENVGDDDEVISTAPSLIPQLEYDFENNDTKYRVFRDHLAANLKEEKLIVFAFFKDTIKYLDRRLSEDGFSCDVLTGDTTDTNERTRILDNFETSNKTKILLCSEIAAEGIDLQFCRTIVNYDLPWNPMRVEQRIGRIDRIGQTAKTINIVNFCISETIDGRIYEHLYSKLGVFHQTIGDLEEIIGEEINQLTKELLSDELTPDQEIRKINDAANAVALKQKMEAELEMSSGALVAYKDYLSEQIGNSHRLGRYVKASEIRLYLDDFFGRSYPGCRLEWDHPAEGCGRIALTYDAETALEQYCALQHLVIPAGLRSARSGYAFTIDPAVLKKLRKRYRALELVNHLHPLIRWITSELRTASKSLHEVSAISLKTDQVSSGTYFYLIQRLNLEGLHKRERLLYSLISESTGKVIEGDKAESVLNEALDHGNKVFRSGCTNQIVLLESLVEHMNALCGSIIDEYKIEMEARRKIQAEQMEAYYERKIQSARRAIATIENKPEDQKRGLELNVKRLAQLESTLKRKQLELNDAESFKVTHADVSCGIIEVVIA
jgi:superfamily II DNA or RNA helicase